MGNAFEQKRTEIYSGFASLIEENLNRAAEEGSILPVNAKIASYLWVGAVNEVIIRWLYTGSPDPVREALPELKKILLVGLSARPEVIIGGKAE